MTSDLPAGDVIVLHDDNGRHAYHALTLAMVALDALATDQSSRALGCAQGARYGCPKAAASSLEQIVCTKAGSFTHPKDMVRACLSVKRPNVKPRDPWVLPIATQNHVSCGTVGVWRAILTRFQSRFALGSLGENTQPHK